MFDWLLDTHESSQFMCFGNKLSYFGQYFYLIELWFLREGNVVIKSINRLYLWIDWIAWK